MNIFKFLGLDENHRKDSKVTQLVKHFDEVVPKHKHGKRLAMQVKKDGVCAIVVATLSGNVSIWSRTGKRFTNVKSLCSKLESMKLSVGVYFGELTCDSVSLEVLSGMVNPNRTKELDKEQAILTENSLVLNFFDVVTLQAFYRGAEPTSYEDRHAVLARKIPKQTDFCKLLPYSEVLSETHLESTFNSLVDCGEEGMVIVNLDADWEAGHKGWRKMKKVRGVDYDLKCIGFEEGTGKYAGKVANLVFLWKGSSTIKCMLGKGWTHDMARDMFLAIKSDSLVSCLHSQNLNPLGKVFQVYALDESSKGKLRLPKVGEQRFDKDCPDV